MTGRAPGTARRSTRTVAAVAGAAARVAASVAGVALVAWSEYVTWRASVDALPPSGLDPSPRPGDVVLVLGFRSRPDGTPGAIQRWRVRIAVRSVDARAATFVFSGGVTSGAESEAAVMARHAVDVLGVPRGSVRLEEESRNTWENVAFSLPLLADAGSIVIASNTFHARRARLYLLAQAPDVASRLRRGADYRFGELPLMKPYFAIYEWRRARLRLDG